MKSQLISAKKITFILLFINLLTYSQENGKWDKNNIKTEVINLNAGEVKSLKIDLPLGTSKVYYTIKVLKKNADIVYSMTNLVSKNTFDPRLILLSEVTKASVNMSDAKIKYSITSLSDGNKSICYNSSEIITDERKDYFDYTNKNCLDISGNNLSLLFNFQSHNKYFPLKIVIELAPFVDNDLKNGWSQNIKNHLYNYLVNSIKQSNSNLSNDVIEKNVNCILTNLTKDYTFQQFQLLAEYEKKNYFQKLKDICDK